MTEDCKAVLVAPERANCLLNVTADKPGLGHVAFEVEDINAIHMGQEYLMAKNYDHSWGVGRHILGAQIFDYWFDPFGNRIEHWTDGDLLNANSPTGIHNYDQRFAPQSSLVDAGVDSLALTQILLSIEEHTGFWMDESLLTPESLESAETLAHLVHEQLTGA